MQPPPIKGLTALLPLALLPLALLPLALLSSNSGSFECSLSVHQPFV